MKPTAENIKARYEEKLAEKLVELKKVQGEFQMFQLANNSGADSLLYSNMTLYGFKVTMSNLHNHIKHCRKQINKYKDEINSTHSS